MTDKTPAADSALDDLLAPQPENVKGYGVAALTPLLKPAHIELIQKTASDYVQEQSVAIRAHALSVIETKSRGVTAQIFQMTTLLQLLSWERLIAVEDAMISEGQLDEIFEGMLASEHVQELGQRLIVGLDWYGATSAEAADPTIVRQLAWKALLLELGESKSGTIAGYKVDKPENWGRQLSAIQQELERFVEWKTTDVRGGRCRNSARIAMRILAPAMPELFFPKPPDSLRYGTGIWVNFAHGVALAEALFAGSSRRLDFGQLIDIPINLGGSATDDEKQFIIEKRFGPALQWAVANGVLPGKALSSYSDKEIEHAMTELDDHQIKLAAAMNTLLSKIPHRIEMGIAKFDELLGFNATALKQLIMRPTELGKRLEYSLRNPSPGVRAGEFYLLDVFIAGHMKQGLDKFEPNLPSHKDFWAQIYSDDIKRLEGVDINDLYAKAFAKYCREAETAYALIIEMLLAEIPFQDRLAIEYGRLDVYLLQQETGIDMRLETHEHRSAKQGRHGFIIVCSHNGSTFAYEMFPLLGVLQRRTDLHPLPNNGVLKVVSNELHRGGVALPVDWLAYQQNSLPRYGIVSQVIPVFISHGTPTASIPASAVSPLSSVRLKSIGILIARQNFFFDKKMQFKAQAHQTWSEYVAGNYPPILRILEMFVPGLSCFNAVQTDETPAVACTIDAGLILAAPLMRFFRGSVQLVMKLGTPALSKNLPSFATLTKQLLASSASSWRSGFNPFESFLFRISPGVGSAGLLAKMAYKINETVGHTLGKPGEFLYVHGLESAVSPDLWRPVALGDRLAMVYGVSNVPVRVFPTADNRVRTYLINTASGNPYGPVLEDGLLDETINRNAQRSEISGLAIP